MTTFAYSFKSYLHRWLAQVLLCLDTLIRSVPDAAVLLVLCPCRSVLLFSSDTFQSVAASKLTKIQLDWVIQNCEAGSNLLYYNFKVYLHSCKHLSLPQSHQFAIRKHFLCFLFLFNFFQWLVSCNTLQSAFKAFVCSCLILDAHFCWELIIPNFGYKPAHFFSPSVQREWLTYEYKRMLSLVKWTMGSFPGTVWVQRQTQKRLCRLKWL